MTNDCLHYSTRGTLCHRKFFNRSFLPTFFVFSNYLHAYAFEQKLTKAGYAVQKKKFPVINKKAIQRFLERKLENFDWFKKYKKLELLNELSYLTRRLTSARSNHGSIKWLASC